MTMTMCELMTCCCLLTFCISVYYCGSIPVHSMGGSSVLQTDPTTSRSFGRDTDGRATTTTTRRRTLELSSCTFTWLSTPGKQFLSDLSCDISINEQTKKGRCGFKVKDKTTNKSYTFECDSSDTAATRWKEEITKTVER